MAASPMNGRYRLGWGLGLYRSGKRAQADRQVELAGRFGKHSARLQYRCAAYFGLRHGQTGSPAHREELLRALEACCATGSVEDVRWGAELLWEFLPQVRYLERILLPEHLAQGIELLTRRGDLADALTLLESDREWRNKSPLLLEAGKLHWLLGRPDKARELWRLAVVLTETTRSTWDQLEVFLGRYRGSWPRFLAQMISQPSVPAEAYYRLARVLLRQRKPRRARAMLDRAIRAQPRESRYLELRSRIKVPR